jgi:hypothetical protein
MKVGIVGAGLFGCLIALELTSRDHEVTLFESEPEILNKASRINQARLHTGMHYPRDLETAKEALESYDSFKNMFHESIKELDQYYAISKHSTKTSPEDYLYFAQKLGIDFMEVNPRIFFKEKIVDLLLKVPESTFDLEILKDNISNKILKKKNLELKLNCEIRTLLQSESHQTLVKSDGGSEYFDKIIFSSYAMCRRHFKHLKLKDLQIEYQVCQVILGESRNLINTGITVMDGPFWSIMPYGQTRLHSLTNVKYTPLDIAIDDKLRCQKKHQECGEYSIFDCNQCVLRPASNEAAILRQLENDLKDNDFKYKSSIYTVKAILSDLFNPSASRPTQLLSDQTGNIMAVLSGKIGSSISLSKEIAGRLER